MYCPPSIPPNHPLDSRPLEKSIMLTFTAWLQLGTVIALELAPILLLTNVGKVISLRLRNVGKKLLIIAGVCAALSILMTATVPYSLLPSWISSTAMFATAVSVFATGVVLVREYLGFKARIELTR